MKKQLLLGSALLAAISAFPQSRKPQPSGVVDMAPRMTSRHIAVEGAPSENVKQPIGPAYDASRASAGTNWIGLSGSMNIFGVSENGSKPLQYHPGLGAVSFIHRKSQAYQPSTVVTPSTAASGCIVGEVTSDLLTASTTGHWDSTLIWSNTTQWARYPQGGIYSPPGNTNVSNAYIIATGPLTSASSNWVGSYLASKKLDVFDNVASTTTGAQQFVPNTGTNIPTYGKFDFPYVSFSVTDDGAMRTTADISDNINGTTGATQKFRGARILKATFNAGVFTWSGDSVIPSVVGSAAAGPQLISRPFMCWNQAGTIGYVWFLGGRSGKTKANQGIQPIVYKTTNSGGTWAEIPGIDFNGQGGTGYNPEFFGPVISRLDSVRAQNLKIPLMTTSEGTDGVVDVNGDLHIVTTLLSTSTSHQDSLFYTYSYKNHDGEKYSYAHYPGFRPFIYDFHTSSTGWKVTVVDSMSSEGPGTRTSDNGYSSNPWDADPSNSSNKMESNARIKCSRSVDGKYIVYSWTESDTNYTSSSFKWNNIPNLKARCMDLSGTMSVSVNGNICNDEINITNPSTGAFGPVQSNAQMHHMSPVCKVTGTTATTFSLVVPITVSNNQSVPLTQLLPNNHYYTSAQLVFTRPGVGIAENALTSVKSSELYPNPAKGSANLRINLKDNSKVELKVMNLVGQVMTTKVVEGMSGDNNVNVDLDGLSSGIYLVNIKVGNAVASKKLIVE